jgi:hypothetical protein
VHLAIWLGEVWSRWRLGSGIEIYRECSLPRSALSVCIAQTIFWTSSKAAAAYHNNPYLSIPYGHKHPQAQPVYSAVTAVARRQGLRLPPIPTYCATRAATSSPTTPACQP